MKHNAKALAVLPLALAVSAAFAADDNDYTTLDTSVISATGYAQDTREAPGSITVIPEKELMTRPITDLGTALVDVPGVDITFTKMGTSKISIRGFDSKYTLMMVDGRRQNYDSGMNFNGFETGGIFMPPPGAVERIEVIRGPASTIYGSDAIGGAVNVVMKKHVKDFTGSLSVERTQFEDSAWDNRWGTGAYLGIPLKDNVASLILRGRYLSREASNLRTADGKYATHTTAEGFTGNIGGRLTVSPNEDNDVYVDLDYTRFKGGTMSTSAVGFKAQRWYNKYAAVIGHEGRYKIGDLSSYFQFQGMDLMKTKNGAPTVSGAKPDAQGANTSESGTFADPLISSRYYTLSTKLKSPVSFGEYGDAILQGGLQFDYQTYVDNQQRTAGSELLGKELNQTLVSGFGEGEYFINEQWIATLGARVQWSDIFGAHVAPRAYLVWKPTEVVSFKGGVASGYQTPAVKQLYNGVYNISQPHGGAGYETYTHGNPDLKPEESWNYELSSTVKLGQAASVTAGVFYTDFKNKLGTREVNDDVNQRTDVYQINQGMVKAQGAEVFVNTASYYGFRFTGGYTFTDSEIKGGLSDGMRATSMPKHTISARIDYDNGGFNAYVKSLSKLDTVSESVSTGKNGQTTKSRTEYKNYTTVDVGVNYTYAKQHHFSVALNNIFDDGWSVDNDEYRDYVDGRNLWLNYTYTF